MRGDEQWMRKEPEGKIWMWLEAAHDSIFCERNRKSLKRAVIWISIAGFIIHLLLIAFAYSLHAPWHWIVELGPNYLSAISTPFNIILFYEVLTLIAALPTSTTRSIASQYEIVSLIFIRDVFRDIAHANDLISEHRLTSDAMPLFLDMWAGVTMFALVAVFQHIAALRKSRSVTQLPSSQTNRFIGQKKIVAAGLAVLLITMAAWNLVLFTSTAVQIMRTGQGTLESATSFYNDVFTVMIFTDVLVLILSLAVSDRYEMVFRNAAFVASVVLIRFALTEGFPYGAPLAIAAMLFGIVTLLVFNYHVRIKGPVEV
jgi:hypothetical protein